MLLPGGPGGAHVPLKDLLERLAARRSELATTDPPSEVRLRMREVEVLRALQLWDRADAAARNLLAGDKLYLSRQLAQSALARGSPEQALTAIREVGLQDNFWAATDLVEALAKAAEPRPEEYEQALHQALAVQARDADLVFELPTVKRLLDAERIWAEHRGDALAASRFADALDFASR